jgi:hypothetical protein
MASTPSLLFSTLSNNSNCTLLRSPPSFDVSSMGTCLTREGQGLEQSSANALGRFGLFYAIMADFRRSEVSNEYTAEKLTVAYCPCLRCLQAWAKGELRTFGIYGCCMLTINDGNRKLFAGRRFTMEDGITEIQTVECLRCFLMNSACCPVRSRLLLECPGTGPYGPFRAGLWHRLTRTSPRRIATWILLASLFWSPSSTLVRTIGRTVRISSVTLSCVP